MATMLKPQDFKDKIALVKVEREKKTKMINAHEYVQSCIDEVMHGIELLAEPVGSVMRGLKCISRKENNENVWLLTDGRLLLESDQHAIDHENPKILTTKDIVIRYGAKKFTSALGDAIDSIRIVDENFNSQNHEASIAGNAIVAARLKAEAEAKANG